MNAEPGPHPATVSNEDEAAPPWDENGARISASARRLISRAAQLGLEPTVRPSYRGSHAVILDGRGSWAGFGALYIGARSGKVLRAVLTWGTTGPTTRHAGYRSVAGMLQDYARYIETTFLPDSSAD